MYKMWNYIIKSECFIIYVIVVLLPFVVTGQTCQTGSNKFNKDVKIPCPQNEDTCQFPAEERADCGYHGITEQECLDKGCCHNSTTGEVQAPFCFYSKTETCVFPVEDRRDCGYSSIPIQECIDRGCCYNSSTGGIEAPHCFFKEIGVCDIPDYDRRDCGYAGISQEECEANLCCFKDGIEGAPSCYPMSMDSFSVFKSNGNEKHDIFILTHRNTFSFLFKACHSAHVYLRTKAYSDETGYRFVFGSEGLSDNIIFQKYVDNVEVDRIDKPTGQPVVSCNSSYSYEIEWLAGNLWIRTTGDTVVFEYEDSSLLNIVEVKLFTQGTIGEWYFLNTAGREMNVATSAQEVANSTMLSFDQIWIELKPQQTDLQFKIGANKNTYLVLCENIGNVNFRAFEVGVGTEENTKSHIKNRETGDIMDILTQDILTGPNQFRHLWVSWKNGHVQLGYGHNIGQDTILDQNFDQVNVRFISLANIDTAGTMAYWEFRQNTEDMYYANTPAVEGDEVENWKNRAHFNTYSPHVFFTVHTCADAYIYLATDTAAYRFEIIIGYQSNSEVSIMVNGQPETRMKRHVDGLVSCTESRMFWINWIGDHIVVGKGSRLDQYELMTFYNSVRTNDVTGLAFRSTTHSAEWTVAKSLVYQAIFQPYNNMQYDYWLDLDYNRLEAHAVVRACSDVHFIFSEYPGVVDRSCEVVLGAYGNRVNLILDGYQGKTLASYNNSVLNCDRHHNFWFTWGDGQFRIGVGTTIGQHFIMAVSLEEFSRVLDIRAIGVASNSSNTEEPVIQFADSNEVAAYTYFSKPENDRALQFITERHYFQFKVRVCSSAIVILSDNPDLAVAKKYEIHFGSDSNTRITVKRDGNNVKTVTPSEPPLNCFEIRSFWITWNNTQLHVGSGDVVNEAELLYYEDTTDFIFPLRSVKLESQDEKDGLWVINRQNALSARITTQAKRTFNNIWLSVDTESYIIFSVKAVNETYIALGTLLGTPGMFETTEIKLGSSQSVISYKDPYVTRELNASDTPDLLADTEYRYFWISWYNGNLEVGTGSTVGQGAFMTYQFETPNHYVTLALSSGAAVGQAHWIISSAEDNFAQLHTSGLYFQGIKYYHMNMNLKFKVKACRDAHIGMFAGSDYNDKSYEIVIGGRDNTITYIKKGFESSWEPDQEMSTPDVLHCYEPRGFTLNWGPAGISLTSDTGSYFTWVDPDYRSVDFLSFATEGVIGNWYFPRYTGDKFIVSTYNGEAMVEEPEALLPPQSPRSLHDLYKYNSFWIAATDQRSTRIIVKACAEAHVALSKYYGITEFEFYEIRIGEHQDNFVTILIDNMECNRAEVETLECSSFASFWISWENSVIQIGQGDIVGQLLLTSCKVNYLEVNGISVATDKGNDGIWVFEDYRGDELLSFWTNNDYPYWSVDKVWMVPRQKWFTFEVQTKEWVVVALSEKPWITDTRCHEIHIGVQEHTSPQGQISYIIDKDDEESPKVTVHTPSAVDKDNLNSFWISWENQILSVGYGYGKNGGPAFMKLPHTLPHDVNAVGFATPKTDSRWELPRDLARQFHVKFSDDILNTNQVEASIRGLNSLVFQVLASDGIEVDLITDMGNKAYSFVIGYDNNRYTALYDEHRKILTRKETPDILSSVYTQTFWISWDTDMLQMGRGGQIGQDIIITQKVYIPKFHKALYYGNTISTTEFIFVEILGPTYNILTSTDWGYNVAWMETTVIEVSFRVRACADAHILLAQDLLVVEENKVYEIVLGGSGNTILYLRKGPLANDVASAFEDNLVSCNAFRRFWVSWDDNTIRIGSGYRSQGHVYLEYKDDNFSPVNYLAVSSGFGSQGEWEIQHGQSDGIIIYTPKTDDYNYENAYITIQGQENVAFEVKACSNAHVTLSEIPNVVTMSTYEIVLGAGDGKTVGIRSGISGDFLETTSADNLLDCNTFKIFWISWSANYITIGRGKDVTKDAILQHTIDVNQAFSVNGISFKTGSNIAGEWNYISHGVNPDNPNKGGLSGGAVAGIVIGVLVAVIFVIAVIFIFIPSTRIKAEQMYIAVKDKFSSSGTNLAFESPIYASEVGYETDA